MANDDAPGAGPVWIPEARLAGFIKRTTIHCYTQNMEVLGLVVSKKIFLCLFHCKSMRANDPQGGAISDPMGMLGRIYVKLHITMPYTKYRSYYCCGFREEDFFMSFSILSLWQKMMPSGRACMDPRGTVSRIYKEDHYTLLHTKYESSGLVVSEKIFFYVFPIVSLWELMTPGVGHF